MTTTPEQFLWVERYRPRLIQDCVLPESVKKQFAQFIKKGEIPNLLLSGTAGTGKTTIARALCNAVSYTHLTLPTKRIV